MFSDDLVGDEDVADREHATRSEQRVSPYRHLRRYRVCVLLVLAIFGLHLLADGPGVNNGYALKAQQAFPGRASIQAAQTSASRASVSAGLGAGISASERTGA